MKRLIAILLCAVSTAWSSTEYLRPTADANQTVASVCGVSGYSDIASTSMSAVYSGKSGVGPTGSSAVLSLSAGTTDRFTSRTFSGFPNSSYTYTASPILYVNAGCATVSAAACSVYYSVNSGSSWTQLYYANTTTSQTTYTATLSTLTGPTLSSLQVVACASVLTATATVSDTQYDIWTAGTYTGSTSHAQPWLLSELDEKIWRWHDARREHLAQSPPY